MGGGFSLFLALLVLRFANNLRNAEGIERRIFLNVIIVTHNKFLSADSK